MIHQTYDDDDRLGTLFLVCLEFGKTVRQWEASMQGELMY